MCSIAFRALPYAKEYFQYGIPMSISKRRPVKAQRQLVSTLKRSRKKYPPYQVFEIEGLVKLAISCKEYFRYGFRPTHPSEDQCKPNVKT